MLLVTSSLFISYTTTRLSPIFPAVVTLCSLLLPRGTLKLKKLGKKHNPSERRAGGRDGRRVVMFC